MEMEKSMLIRTFRLVEKKEGFYNQDGKKKGNNSVGTKCELVTARETEEEGTKDLQATYLQSNSNMQIVIKSLANL